MKCPRDKQTLHLRDNAEHGGLFCPSCSGAWLPKRAIESLPVSTRIKLEGFAKTLSETSQVSNLRCPQDGALMKTYVADKISIDYCSECLGFWFDKHELDDFIKQKGNDASALSDEVASDVLAAIFLSF